MSSPGPCVRLITLLGIEKRKDSVIARLERIPDVHNLNALDIEQRGVQQRISSALTELSLTRPVHPIPPRAAYEFSHSSALRSRAIRLYIICVTLSVSCKKQI